MLRKSPSEEVRNLEHKTLVRTARAINESHIGNFHIYKRAIQLLLNKGAVKVEGGNVVITSEGRALLREKPGFYSKVVLMHLA